MIKVLILEDDKVNVKILSTILRNLHHDIQLTAYSNVEACFNRLGSVEEIMMSFDLVVVDLFLSGEKTGIDFISTISREYHKKIVVSSAIDSLEYLKLKTESQFKTHFLAKPIDPNAAIARFKDILSEFPPEKKLYIASPPKHEINNKPVILVTGCSSGIGFALSKLLVENDYYRIVLTARDKSLPILKENFIESDNLIIHQLDLTKDIQIKECLDHVETAWGPVDVLINVAGVCYRSAIEHMDTEAEYTQLQTNYLGPISLIKKLIPSMREKGRGKIINVSSVSGMIGMPTMGSYTASKHALDGISESLWYELKPFGINISIIRPGFVNSDSYKRVITPEKAKLARRLMGPYYEFYNFMNALIERLMKLSFKNENDIAHDIIKILQTQNPPLYVNATLDAKLFSLLKKIMPEDHLHSLFYTFLNTLSHWGRAHTKARTTPSRKKFLQKNIA